MEKLIDADKLLAWLKIREGEAYTNADQVFNPSFLLGKADAFNDVVEYVKSGHSDLAPSPTIKPGDEAKHPDLGQVRIMDDPVIHVLKGENTYEVYLSDLEQALSTTTKGDENE